MRYFGGKYRIASWVANKLQPLVDASPQGVYIEPFCGSCNVASRVRANRMYLADKHPDLIALWVYVQRGGTLPENVSEEQYTASRHLPSPHWLRGFAGFGCSFGGKFYGGYARQNSARNYALNAKNSLMKKISTLNTAMFGCCDYTQILVPDGAVVYCDPPYSNTTGYSCGTFDTETFWTWVRSVSKKAKVVVSEYAAPSDMVVLGEKITETDMRVGVEQKKEKRIERLYIYR